MRSLTTRIRQRLRSALGGAESWKDRGGSREAYRSILKQDELTLLHRLREQCKGRAVQLGPWVSEVGFELLYWIPFLRWLVVQKVFDPARAQVITRGGASVWYGGLASDSLDLYSLHSASELRDLNIARADRSQTQKHIEIADFERAALEVGRQRPGFADAVVIHPSEMYLYLYAFISGRGGSAPFEVARRCLEWEPFAPPPRTIPAGALPENYLAVKFYFRSSFESTPANTAFMRGLLDSLRRSGDVVLLNSRVEFDDHLEYSPEAGSGLHFADGLMRPETNLAVQSEILAGARGFFGTYGGLSYLPLFYGRPSVGFYDSPAGLNWMHLHLAQEASLKLGQPFHLWLPADYDTFLRSASPPS